MTPLPTPVYNAAEKLLSVHRSSGTISAPAAIDDLRSLFGVFGVEWEAINSQELGEASEGCLSPEESL